MTKPNPPKQEIVPEGMCAILGQEGCYSIARNGCVWSHTRTRIRKNGQSRVYDGKVLVPKLNNKGYWQVAIWKDGRYKNHLIHRLLAQAFIPNPEGFPVVNHLDGNPINNTLENLEWCTYGENLRHAYEIGLFKTKKTRAKLLAKQKGK